MPASALLRRALSAVLALLLPLAAAHAARPPLPPLDGQVIVKFKAGGDTLRAHALSARADAASARSALVGRAVALGARVGRALEAGAAAGDRVQVVRASGISSAELAALLSADPDVEYASPNERVRRLAGGTAEPFYQAGPAASDLNQKGGPVVGQWYLRAPDSTVLSSINIEPAWSRTTGSASVVVAVLDNGIRSEHPEFLGMTVLGYDFVDDADFSGDGDRRDSDPTDPGDFVTPTEAATTKFTNDGCGAENSSWHGTATASLVGARANGVGMSGVAPTIQLMFLRVLGKCGGSVSDIVAAMRWAVGIDIPGIPHNDHPAKVLNLSLGSDTPTCSAAYQSAVDDVVAAGATVVVAAGNSEGKAAGSPSTCQGVISVAAVRHAGTKVGFSSVGPAVTLSAPGGNCVVDRPKACVYPLIAASNSGTQGPLDSTWFDSYLYEYGTSFSAPLVSGVVALMYSLQPNLSPDRVKQILQSTARAFPTRPSGSTVPVCQAPSNAIQDECYCTSATCGAGMLDAGAAVAAAAVSGPVARITVTPASPVAGSAITLSATTSTPSGTNTITGYSWVLADGGGIVSGTANGGTLSTGVTATVTPTAGGSFSVTLSVTDSTGATGQVSQSVSVTAASTGGSGGGGGGGGGAMSAPWLALLAAAVLLLFRRAPRRA